MMCRFAMCCSSLREEISSLKKTGENELSRGRLDSELESVRSEVEELRAVRQQLERELSAREKSIESYNKRIGLLKEESQQLTQQVS